MIDDDTATEGNEDRKRKPGKIVDFDAGEDWPVVEHALEFPFRISGVTYQTVSIRPPTAGEADRFLAVGGDGKTNYRKFVQALTGLPDDALEKMIAADRTEIYLRVGELLGDVQRLSI